MSGCGRQWCSGCGEELIHRDHRKNYESASALGQIIWREGPLRLSVTDLDVVSRKGLPDGSQLLRLIEQKQPGHRFDSPQMQTLRLLDQIVSHASLCDAATELHVNPRSGVYIIRGEVGATVSAHRETSFIAPQEIEKLSTGQTYSVNDHEEFFRFLDPEDPTRRRPRRIPE